MEFPGKEIKQSPATSLPEAVIQYTGWQETDHDLQHLERPNSELYAMQLGRACIAAARESNTQARNEVKKARATKRKLPSAHMPHHIRNELINVYGDIIHHRYNPNAFKDARRQFYDDSIHYLSKACNKVFSARETTSNWVGLTNELTALCLLNRYEHPWMVAIPALKHHDRKGTFMSDKYDIALITSLPGQEYGFSGGTELALLDIKSSDMHLEDHPEEKNSVFSVDARNYFSYAPDATAGNRFPAVARLLREHSQEGASTEDIRWLDGATDELVLDASFHAEETPVIIPNDFAHTA